jgi:hypothetical protein
MSSYICAKCGVDKWDAEIPKKETILEEAARIVNGPRRKEYGHPKVNFQEIAGMWNVVLKRTPTHEVAITPDQVILCMIALKLCRAKQGFTRDCFVDIAGYAQCWELVNE